MSAARSRPAGQRPRYIAQASQAQRRRRDLAEQRARGEKITYDLEGSWLSPREYAPLDRPSIYAIGIATDVWPQFGLSPEPASREPWIYVGKAQNSLASRTLKTYFGYDAGCTGRSSFRRTLVALLRERLDLEVMPRNLLKPGHYDRYGMSPPDEWELGCWINDHVVIADWAWVHTRRDEHPDLAQVERDVIALLQAAFNFTNCRTPWTDTIKAKRAEAAAFARDSSVSRGLYPGSSSWSVPSES